MRPADLESNGQISRYAQLSFFNLKAPERMHRTFKARKFNQLPVGGWPSSFRALSFEIKSDIINSLN
jgi:hypothetical protein